MATSDHFSPWWMDPHGPPNMASYTWDCLESTHTLAQQWVENLFTLSPHGGRHPLVSGPDLDSKQWIWLQAHQQSSGIGQHGRSFFSPLGGLYATLVCLFPCIQTAALPLITALSIAEVLGQDCTLKWVNDVYWDNEKIAGVLIHRYWGANPSPCIVSLGVNINTRHTLHPIPMTSLYRKTGRTWDIQTIFQKIQIRLVHHFQSMIANNGLLSSLTVQDMNRRLRPFGQIVRLQTPMGTILGRCCGINAFGRIILDSGQDYDVLALGIEGENSVE